MQGYDLTAVEDLQAFSAECYAACQQCPQYSGGDPVDAEGGVTVYSNITDARGVLRHWARSSTLFKAGYSAELSDKAKDTFRRFSILITPLDI